MEPILVPDPPLSDGTVTLRVATEADIPAVVEACRDPEIPRFTTVPSPYGEKDARDWFRLHSEAVALGTGADFAMVNGSEDFVGAVGVRLDSRGDRIGEVGYWVAAPARGRGYATRGLALIRSWAFDELGVERLQLTTHVDNRASQRVAEKAGFTREGTLRRWRRVKGERVDLVMYSLLPDDPT